MDWESSERHEIFKIWIEGVTNKNTKQYIQERVIKQMDWYHTKSSIYKIKYQRWMTVSIIFSGIIPVASVFADGGIIVKVLISALGASVTGINAYLNLKNYKDLWNIYRSNRELLLRTLYLYFNGVGVFEKQKDQDSRDAMLIDMCENYFMQESNSWKKLIE